MVLRGAPNGNDKVGAVKKRLNPYVRVIGLPGVFTDWGLNLIRKLSIASGMGCSVSQLEQNSPIASDILSPSTQILLTHGPHFSNGAPPDSVGCRTIVFIDDPAVALHELLAKKMHPRDAIRSLTAVLAPLSSVLSEAGTITILRTPDLSAAAAVRAIASHIGLASVAATVANAVNELPDNSTEILPLSSEVHELARQALMPLLSYVLGYASEAITWPLGCFIHGDRPGKTATEKIDLVGPKRLLFYGPYFHLPLGRWRVEIEVYFSDAHSTFLVDVYTHEKNRALAEGRLRPQYGGAYKASLPFAIERPEAQIELRLWLEQGALEGQAALRHATFYPDP